MLRNALPEALGEERGNSVPHLSGLGVQIAREDKVRRERLQARGLADAYCAVLLRVSKSSVRVADTPSRQCWCGRIPLQTAIHVGESVESRLPARGDQARWQVAPSSARRRRANALNVDR